MRQGSEFAIEIGLLVHPGPVDILWLRDTHDTITINRCEKGRSPQTDARFAPMNIKPYLFPLLCALLLQACGLAGMATPEPTPAATPVADQTATVQATAAPTTAALPTRAPTATIESPTLTPEPTATVWPPTFAIWSFQDFRALDSFIVTINEKNTVNGTLTELTTTIGYIKEPFSAYRYSTYEGGEERTVVVDGWTFTQTGSGDWTISAGSSESLFSKAQIPTANTDRLVGAQFAEQTVYEGIPAYHFVLAPEDSVNGNTTNRFEGDFHLAIDGNYVLSSHWTETSSQGDFTQVYEVAEALSSIDQVPEIRLPDDMQAMAAAIELPAELGLPVPGDSAVRGMIRYEHGIGVDLYTFTNPKMTLDDFLEYYRRLPATNGWQVTHVGHVSLHENDCEFIRECVMMRKGDTQVVLHYDGTTLRVEFDWPGLFAPVK